MSFVGFLREMLLSFLHEEEDFLLHLVKCRKVCIGVNARVGRICYCVRTNATVEVGNWNRLVGSLRRASLNVVVSSGFRALFPAHQYLHELITSM